MHNLKHVHDAFKFNVLQFSFHPNHCIHCNVKFDY